MERFSVIMVGGAAALFRVFQGQREEITRWCACEVDPVKAFCIFPRIAASLSRPCNAAPEAGGVCFCPTEGRYTLDHIYAFTSHLCPKSLLVLAKKTLVLALTKTSEALGPDGVSATCLKASTDTHL